jgi:periplasmic divalent cation tolerance protein
MSEYLQVTTVADSRELAEHLAQSAVSTHLAASAQVIGPVHSVFWHEGELGSAPEWKIVLKTTASRYVDLRARLLAEHTWSNPEITAVEITKGTDAYFEWLTRTVATES